MKKLLKPFIVILMVLYLSFSATGCFISNDWNKVQTKLEKKGYEVYCETNNDEITAFLEDTFYTYETSSVNPEKIKCILIATKENKQLILAFCEDVKTAEKVEDLFDDFEEDFVEIMGIAEKDCDSDTSGKIAYIGHDDAIKILIPIS